MTSAVFLRGGLCLRDGANPGLCAFCCLPPQEFAIGHFDRAIDPNIRTFAEFPRFVHDNREAMAGKKVFMYCTGGIRCEKASSLMLAEGFPEVYQLKGGIHRYMEAVRFRTAQSAH